MLSVKDVAFRLDTSVETVKKIIEKGNLDATKYGNKFRISSLDMDELGEKMKGRSIEDFI